MPPAADIIRRAAQLNRDDPRRQGSCIQLTGQCEVIVSGDIHGNRQNLAKILAYANLPGKADRFLVLQEIIHGPADPASGQDRSIELLLRAARLKCAHEAQVLFVLGNHDVAQITGSEITKNGQSFCKSFAEGVGYSFGQADAAEILDAVAEFLLSLPLAVRCDNGVLIAHSLPSARQPSAAETLSRPFGKDDLSRRGGAYNWTWGRGHTPEQLESLAGELGVEFFILGHRHAAGGLEVLSRRAVVLASDHPHGQIIHFSTDSPLSAESAQAKARPIVALGAD